MKHIYIAILFFIYPFMLCAQIEFDKAEQDGSRKIGSTELFIRTGFTDTKPFYYRIVAVQQEQEIQFFLNVHINGAVPDHLNEGSLILIKTASGDVLESKNINPEHETYDIIHKNLYGCYPFLESEIKKMAADGISKIRIEAPLNTIDIESTDKKTKAISDGLAKRYKSIVKALSIKKDIREGF